MKQVKWTRVLQVSAVVLVFAIAGAAPAAASERGWEVRVEGVRVDPSLDYSAFTSDGFPVDVTGGSDTGLGIGVGYRFSDHVGLEFGILQARPEVKADVTVLGGEPFSISDGLRMRSYMAALAFHLTPNRAIDISVSPLIAYTAYGDLSFTVDLPGVGSDTLNVDVAKDFGWGLGLGAEIPLGTGGWQATGSIRYLDSELGFSDPDSEFTDEVNSDVTIISLGIGYRF